MKPSQLLILSALATFLLSPGCAKKSADETVAENHDDGHHEHGHSESEKDASASAARFTEGKGLTLSAETARAIGVTTTLVKQGNALVIPRSALLESASGSFVYLVNGDAFLRRTVKISAQRHDEIEIAEGLKSGDSLVTSPVETLWLTELRLTKGGGHSH